MNYMPEVAKMLGVELGERFQIEFNSGFESKHHKDNEYYWWEHGIQLDKEGHACISSDMLHGILCGSISIKRKPWKPEYGECYHFINEQGLTTWDTWGDSCEDIILYKLGNCYQTREKADKDAARWLAFYKSDDVLEI